MKGKRGLIQWDTFLGIIKNLAIGILIIFGVSVLVFGRKLLGALDALGNLFNLLGVF